MRASTMLMVLSSYLLLQASPGYALPESEDATAEATGGLVLQGSVMKERRARSHPHHNASLEGNASEEGADQQEVAIDWDQWRNRFCKAVWSRMNQRMAGDVVALGPLQFKLGSAPASEFQSGLGATYSCKITSDGRVTEPNLVKRSGNDRFDELLLESLNSLHGKHVLQFPKGSQRSSVSAEGWFRTGKKVFHEGKTGDVERVK